MFWISGNRNEYFTKIQQNLQHYPNWCVSTLPNVKTSHFETTGSDRFLECVRRSIQPVVCNFRSRRKPSNVHLFYFFVQNFFVQNQSSGRKSLHFHRFLIKILSSNSIRNSIYLMLRSNSMKYFLWRAGWRNYDVIKTVSNLIVGYSFLFPLIQKV